MYRYTLTLLYGSMCICIYIHAHIYTHILRFPYMYMSATVVQALGVYWLEERAVCVKFTRIDFHVANLFLIGNYCVMCAHAGATMFLVCRSQRVVGHS